MAKKRVVAAGGAGGRRRRRVPGVAPLNMNGPRSNPYAGNTVYTTSFQPVPFDTAASIGVVLRILRREIAARKPIYDKFVLNVLSAYPTVKHVWLVMLPLGKRWYVRAIFDPVGAMLRDLRAEKYAAVRFGVHEVAQHTRKAGIVVRTAFYHPKVNSASAGRYTFNK